MNRVFKWSPLQLPAPDALTDVTSTGRACDQNQKLKADTALIRNYVIPALQDDEGIALISAIIECLHLALCEQVHSIRVSHGTWLSIHCEFVAQHRRKQVPEILNLRFLLGPCTSDDPTVFVLLTPPPSDDEAAPF